MTNIEKAKKRKSREFIDSKRKSNLVFLVQQDAGDYPPAFEFLNSAITNVVSLELFSMFCSVVLFGGNYS